MTYVKINDTLYPAVINGRMADREWGGRESKSITLEMDYATANALFVDGLAWSIVEEAEDENGTIQQTEWDNSEFDIAGTITDHRDGRVTVKMGKITDGEALAELMEVLA